MEFNSLANNEITTRLKSSYAKEDEFEWANVLNSDTLIFVYFYITASEVWYLVIFDARVLISKESIYQITYNASSNYMKVIAFKGFALWCSVTSFCVILHHHTLDISLIF